MPKIKTVKSLKKRLKVTKSKIMFSPTSRRHCNLKKKHKFIRSTRKPRVLHKSNLRRLKTLIDSII